jgi:hypothetical protein
MATCIACKKDCPEGFAIGSICYQCLEETVVSHISQNTGKVRRNEFQGLELKNYYCDGYFGSREYNMQDAIVIENTENLITARKRDGQIVQAHFDEGEDVRVLVKSWLIVAED